MLGEREVGGADETFDLQGETEEITPSQLEEAQFRRDPDISSVLMLDQLSAG